MLANHYSQQEHQVLCFYHHHADLCYGHHYWCIAAGLKTADCSGLCFAGYLCGFGSSSPTQLPCGGTQYYCDRGSSVPSTVLPGHYTVSAGIAENAVDFWDPRNMTRTAQILREPGFVCTAGAKLPVRTHWKS